MIGRCLLILIVSLVVVLGSPVLSRGDDRENDQTALRSISGVIQENYARFPHGSVRFRFQDGFAPDSAQARAGHFTKSAEADGLLVFDQGHTRFQIIFPIDAMTKETTWPSSSQSSSWLSSFRYVTNNEVTLLETISAGRDGSPVFGRGFLAGVDLANSHFEFPLTLGAPQGKHGGISGNLLAVLEQNPIIRVTSLDLNATREGNKLVRVNFSFLDSQQDCWADLERGGVAVYDRLAQNGLVFEEFCEDIRQVPGHGWLPFLWTRHASDGRTNRIIVDQADFDHPPTAKDFTLSLSRPAVLFDPRTERQYEGKHKDWNLDHLPPVVTDGAPPRRITKISQPPLPELPGEIDRPSYPLTTSVLAILSVVALFLLARAVLVRRSRVA